MKGCAQSGTPVLTRRGLLALGSGAFVAAAVPGGLGAAGAGSRDASRGGTLRFATRGDAVGLDPHRNTFYLVSNPLAATSQGLMDLNLRAEPVPGVAETWEASQDLRTYTFKLRKGVLFHNGRIVDAGAVRWNFERIQDPRSSHPFIRAALANLKSIEVLDKYTVRCHLMAPSAAFLSDVVYYPCNLIAPDSVEQVNLRPVGCGPFKFVRWSRYEVTELKRFEHYFETDAKGNRLPYLDGIIGRPKKEDRTRLTALRSEDVDLIDTMAYADAAMFPKKYAGQFRTWEAPNVGTSYVMFNLDKGPFVDRRLRQAAAYAIDHAAIAQTVFYGHGKMATGFYAPASPWYVENNKPYPAYDPDNAKFLLRQAKAEGTEVVLQALASYPYLRQTGEVLQAMWEEAGFKVTYYIDGAPVLRDRRRDRAFHAEVSSASYNFDPDGWFSRMFLSTSVTNRMNAGFRHDKMDRLITEARQTADKQKRLELYTAIESIVNEELPVLYLHHIALLTAGSIHLKGYKPGISGAFSSQGAGIRTAWLA